MNFKRKHIFAFIPLALLLLITDIGLRIFLPRLGEDIFAYKDTSIESKTWFIFNQEIGYEFKPYAVFDFAPDNPYRIDHKWEKLNSQGLRGPEYEVSKPDNTYRILVIGDSCAKGHLMGYKETWEYSLEKYLNLDSNFSGSGIHYEVINAGIGGYVSWQALKRIETRGIRYQPDLVLLLIGANDLLYSTLDYWKPEISLVDIMQFYNNNIQEAKRPAGWDKIRLSVYRYSYFSRLIRKIRNIFWNYQYEQNLIRQHQKDSGLPFNQEALNLYLENLESIYGVLKENNIHMGLIIWPSVLTWKLIDDPDVHKKLKSYYSIYRLSNSEFLSWVKKYTDVQKSFSENHAGVLLIDVESAFSNLDKEERLSLFLDLMHPTVKGNHFIAKEIFRQLKQKIITP